MSRETLNGLFQDQLLEMHEFEVQMADLLSVIVKQIESDELHDLFREQIEEVLRHRGRLERIAEGLDFEYSKKSNPAMEGLLTHARAAMNRKAAREVQEVAIICAVQHLKQYQLTVAELARHQAEMLGHFDFEILLDAVVREKRATQGRLIIFGHELARRILETEPSSDVVVTSTHIGPIPSEEDEESGLGQGAMVGGAAMGAVTGAMIGAPAGPVGIVIGTGIGALAGGLMGQIGGSLAHDEAICPVSSVNEHNYWRQHFAQRPYAIIGDTYERYAAAYQYGWESFLKHKGHSFDELEEELGEAWGEARGMCVLEWDQARDAVRDAWERAENVVHQKELR